MEHYVFVYGTLLYNERNHRLIEGAHRVAKEAWMTGRLVDTTNGYPALVLDSDQVVYGEVYSVTGELLEKIDELEGYVPNGDSHYERKVVEVETDFGTFEAYTYYYESWKAESLREVPFGDWRLDRQLKDNVPYYFAYGSCMDDERINLAGKLEEFDRLGVGRLDGYELQFTVNRPDGGRADIVEAEGEAVEGVVYEITEAARDYLYEREGVHSGMYRPAIVDVKFRGDLVPMLTFIVIDKKDEIAPPDHYLTEILRGGAPDVSEAYLEKVRLRAERLNGGEISGD
ncbi:gamma-glutamylcyclotransferase [Alkalibacillus haloalkaliphilus]|uniref:Putative gamma-glutamylcyclotransferase YkqA n=1 Tax=Alkalibacillus haloalkaliphilus TaxID=94136 RepID=A0A511W3P8_9BACI|nr:gamma-glutamylcyclotransferase family protein [Alkalibacillus haloalkaliphilus]GEN45381.1 putative gamma-glutamylcyclotransferase YkqA [Alkalibacillus haloalkaliphilus]